MLFREPVSNSIVVRAGIRIASRRYGVPRKPYSVSGIRGRSCKGSGSSAPAKPPLTDAAAQRGSRASLHVEASALSPEEHGGATGQPMKAPSQEVG